MVVLLQYLSILFQKCKSEDASLKTVFKTSINRSDFKEKNDQFVGTKRGKYTYTDIFIFICYVIYDLITFLNVNFFFYYQIIVKNIDLNIGLVGAVKIVKELKTVAYVLDVRK